MLVMNKNHPYHLIDVSPWPIFGAFTAMLTMTGSIKWFDLFNANLLLLSFVVMLFTMFQWRRCVTREGNSN